MNKKIVLYTSICYLTILLTTFITVKIRSNYINNKQKYINEISCHTDQFEEHFYKNNIPDEYSDAFLYYTKDHKDIRISFYSIMIHESNNFKVFRHKNKNGSIDLGPSHLNSRNIENEYFRYLYDPKDESYITSKYCYYMVMSINYYIDLLNKYGSDYAFYAYNGGEKTISMIKNNTNKNSSLIKNVKSYNKRVNEILDNSKNELSNYINEEINTLLDKKYNFGKNIKEYTKKLENSIYKRFNDLFVYIRKNKILYLFDKKFIIFAHNPFISKLYVDA